MTKKIRNCMSGKRYAYAKSSEAPVRIPPERSAFPVTRAASEPPSVETSQKTVNSAVPHSISRADPRM
jgi:hypothetical protein